MPQSNPNKSHPKTFRQRFSEVFARRRQIRRAFFEDLRRRTLRYESLEDRSLLATVTWDGGAGTLNFLDANNWDNDAIPSAVNDYVIPVIAGTPTIVVAATNSVRSLASAEKIQLTSGTWTLLTNSSLSAGITVAGGSLSLASGSTVTVSGSSTWTGTATIVGGGTFRNEGVMVFATTAARAIPTRLENAGTFSLQGTVVGSVLQVNTGTLFDNLSNGILELANTASSASPITFAGTAGTITNSGTIRKINTIATALINVPVTNRNGAIEVATGTLAFASSGTGPLFDGGIFNVMPGATLDLGNPRIWKGIFGGSGGGMVLVDSGTQTIDPAGAIFNLPSGMMNWTTGMSGGEVTVAAGSYFQVGGGAVSQLITNRMNVLGTLLRAGASGFFVNTPGELRVQPSGAIVINTTGNISAVQGNGTLNVSGVFRKVSTDNSVMSPTLNLLGGSIDVQAGALTISGSAGSFENGTLNAASGATLTLSGTRTWKGTFTGAGNISCVSGFTVDPAGLTLNFPNGMNWSGGSMSGGVVTIPAGAVFAVNSTTAKILFTQLEVFGTFNTQGAGNFAVDNPGVLHIKPGGTLNVGNILVGLQVGSTAGQVVNEGTLRTAVSGASITPPLNNIGVVDVQAGQLLSISGAITQHPGTTLLGGTWNVAGSLSFPSSGSAVTSIGAGASVTLNGGSASFSRLEASQLQSNQGQLTIKGGKSFSTFRQFSNSGTITVEIGSSLTVPNTNPSPSYTQTAGSTVLAGGSITSPAMTLSGGILRGTGTITTNLSNNGGVVGPGASPGKINITGNYIQGAAGTFNIEVGGTNAATPDFDQLIVSGTATLGGTLNASVINGFLPKKGETFRFLTAASRVGDFATKNLAIYQGYPLFGTNFGSNFYDLTSLNILVRNTNDSGPDSFRQAILDSNAASDTDRILFNIPGVGPHTISPVSQLPAITQPVTIDGYAQLGASPNTLAVGSNAVLKVELNGTNAGIFSQGLRITAPNTTIKGLAINRFAREGIWITGASATNNVLTGNFIGTDVLGISGLGNGTIGSYTSGILLDLGTHHNRIGTDGNGVNDFGERNIISGNRAVAIFVLSHSNIIAGNYVGVSASGLFAIPNGHASTPGAAVAIGSGGSNNRIGTDGSDDEFNESERNVISGHINGNGINVNDLGTDFTVIAGNYIGIDATGQSAIPNSDSGIALLGSALFTRIGTNADGVHDDLERNVISGNGQFGIGSYGNSSSTIQGNFIGTDPIGGIAMGNQFGGVYISGANNVIGGSSPVAGNLISGNIGDGLRINGAVASGNHVEGNFIGVDKTGTYAIGNAAGVVIDNAPSNYVGGVAPGAGNLISGNRNDGVYLQGAGATNNRIEGNKVGTDLDGMIAIPNGFQGITLNIGAHDNVIGGTVSSARNLVSGNTGFGIQLVNSNSNQVKGNWIGVNATGMGAMPNGFSGVVASSGASFNLIGGLSESDRNLISGNAGAGVAFYHASTVSNDVQGNYIGVDAMGTSSIPNAFGGVLIDAAQSNQVGGNVDGAGNVISGNSVAGVWLTSGAEFNTVYQNLVGVDPNGGFAIPNPVGVRIDSGANNNFIGATYSRRNVISGNSISGIQISGVGTKLNTVRGNYIGIDAPGAASIPNGAGVILDGSSDSNIIGDPLSGNTVSGNSGPGVWLTGGALSSSVAYNLIGTDPTGLKDLGNSNSGIRIDGGFTNATVFNNTISGNSQDGVEVSGAGTASQVIAQNRIGLDVTGSLLIGNDRYGIHIGSGANTTSLDRNVISGNSAGIRNDGIGSTIFSNIIGANSSGLKSLGNRRGSGASTGGHFGILSTGPNAQIGNLAAGNLPIGNLVVGHDVGIWIKDASASGEVRENRIGTDDLQVAAMPNTIGLQISGGASLLSIRDNTIANSLSVGLRLLDGTSNTNSFSGNRYFGNLGLPIDAGAIGVTLNDDPESDGVLNFPVLEYSDIVGGELLIRGWVSAGKSIEFYVSTPSVDGRGQGATSIGVLTDDTPGPGTNQDYLTGASQYGPDIRGVAVGTVTSNRFEFRIPLNTLPPELRYGSLITAVALGSTSEFGNAISIGDSVSALAPVVLLPPGITLLPGESLRLQGSFRDDDSTDWTLTVDYGDGTGIQPLAYAPDRSFVLEHEYSTASPSGVPYQVTVRAIDNSNRVGIGVMAVSVTNEPPQPTFNSFHFEPVVQEGSVFTFTGAFSDTGVTDTHIVTVDWGDNTPFTTVAIPVGSRSFNATHVYVDDGDFNNDREFYRILVTIQDNHGGIANTPDGLYIVEVTNALPSSLSIITPSTVVENQTFALSGLFSDLGLVDVHLVTIDWGDGSAKEIVNTSTLVSDPSFHAFDVLHRYADNPALPASAFTVTVTVTDDDDPLHPTVATKSITVTNELPVLSISTSVSSLNEGGILTIAIQVDDSGRLDNHQVFINWGDGSGIMMVNLAPGVTSVPSQTHLYANDPALGTQYTLEVRVRDKDMPPATFVVDSRPITVQNVAPDITSWQLEKRTSTGWTAIGVGGSILEGDEVRVTGTYSDPGLRDLHSAQVRWASGVTTNASVSRSNRTFQASYKYSDDFPIGTAFDDLAVQVALTDNDGGTAIVSRDLRVVNVAPVASFVPEVVTTPGLIPLKAIARDPGTETLSYAWSATDGSVTVNGTGILFNVPLASFGAGPVLVNLAVSDDDGGVGSYSAALKTGSAVVDFLSITTADFPRNPDLTFKTTTLVVLGLGGDDVLDASSLPVGLSVILDGGDGTDLLYGGAGDDTFILRLGNDSANVSATYPPQTHGIVLPPVVPNYGGRDRYFLKPNSTLTVVDLDGTLENSLDFSIASMGVDFNLATTRGATLVPQEVTTGGHFVAALGGFNELVGSSLNDRLTGSSYATVSGGQGADQLKATAGTTDARFSGGQDADVFETSGAGLSTISFEGDDGADTFVNLGSLGVDIEFRGGADADVFTNTLTGVLESLSFEGDDGADVFSNAGLLDAVLGGSITFIGGADADVFTNLSTGILETLSFEGDDGADVFTNAGDLLTQVVFLGGADADVFTNAGTGLVDGLSFEGDDGADTFLNQLHGILSNVSFEGDDGADVFTNLGYTDATVGGIIEFHGGADADVFTNGNSGVLEILSFEGDDGADVFINSGLLDTTLGGTIVFTGGADADVFTNNASGIIEQLSFEGDDGADLFTNIGLMDAIAGGGINFTGGADADVFTNAVGGIVESISFEGDDGADVFTNAGLLDAVALGSIHFVGGADADVFTNTLTGLLESLSFEGDDGADVFTNFGLLDAVIGGTIDFSGGADADVFSNASIGILESLSFEGDDGADIFINAGLLDAVGGASIVFSGGADADVFTNLGTGIAETISFEGDDGADTFVNQGDLLGVLGAVVFIGGADADVFVNSLDGFATNISFEGDDGADVFENLGDVSALGQIVFTGGADSDRLLNSDSGIQSIRYVGFLGSSSAPTSGDDGADIFVNLGDAIGSISFEGDDGADVFSNAGDALGSISFEGDDGADVYVSLGDAIGSISFEGDGGADVLAVYGTNIGSILFAGNASETGDDTFVNRSTASPTGAQTLTYYGFGGNDALRNDGRGWKIQFFGNADNDAFQNNADALTDLQFEGDDGADVFENNGNLLVGIAFEGDDGADVFANGGDLLSEIHFVGGADADVFVNSGDWMSQVSFEGDDGADVFANLGAELSGISFEGDAGNDRVWNDGRDLSFFTFVGGPGSDTFVNRELAVRAANITFNAGLSDDGADVFVNLASALDGLVFVGGADADVFQNSGLDVVNLSFEGDDGQDTVLNTGFGLGDFHFVGGADADVFENRGDELFDILFEGDGGTDSFIQRGNRAVDFIFNGGEDADVFTNFGSFIANLSFEGDGGADRFQNNGSDVGTIDFIGGPDADAFQNNGDSVTNIRFEGGGGTDTFLNNGSNLGTLNFEGDDGADSFIHVGNDISSIVFLGGADSDLMQLTGDRLSAVNFDGAGGVDSLVLDSNVAQLEFTGGDDADVAILRGVIQSGNVSLGDGNDRFVVGAQATSTTLVGGLGDDAYEFASSPSGMYNVVELYVGVSDTSSDLIDFSSMNGYAILNLAITTQQVQPNGVIITLNDGMGIERVIGTTGADNLRGNPRDNYIGGAEFFYPDSGRTPLVAPRPNQWVYLDFSETEPLRGEYTYTAADKQAIVIRLEQAYQVFNQSQNAIRFTLNINEIPLGTDHVTLYFNRTPESGRPGGDASEVDLGNRSFGGSASIQANGLLGGIELPTTDNEDFMEKMPEDSESHLGKDKPAATIANMVEISAKLAAHELAHLLGLRHYDSFGPIGFGVHSPPGNSDFKPLFVGPSAAFETFDHLIGSPASVGSTRNNDVRGLFFGEREAIKISYSLLDPLRTTVNEVSADITSPQAISWVPIAVPNSLTSGLNQPKSFLVDVASIVGSIELDQNAQSQSDYYHFSGRKGDLVTIEVLSKSLRRYLSQGVDGYIDSVIRLRDGNGQLVPYHTSTATNDDEFESSDSLLLDVMIPTDGDYTLEVDTFSRLLTDPLYAETIRMRDELLAVASPTQEQLQLIKLLNDSLLDQDVGNYEVFMYRFQKSSSSDLIDRLAGGGGQDIIDGGPGDYGVIELGTFPQMATSREATSFQLAIGFLDERGLSFTAEVDYGDGSGLQSAAVILSPQPHIILNHQYQDNGNYPLSFSIRSNWGALATGNIAIAVTNQSPVLGNVDIFGAPFLEGGIIAISTSGTDPAGQFDPLVYTLCVWKDDGASPVYVYSNTNPSFAFSSNDNGSYRFEVFVQDGDGGSDQASRTIEIANVVPNAIISTPAPINEGSSATITLTGADASSVDATTLKYSLALSAQGLAADYTTAASSNSVAFSFADNGTYTVYGRVFDKDGGTNTYSTTVVVNNVAPTAIISTPAPINEGSSATITLMGADASSVDATTLKYSLALSAQGLAADYTAAASSNSGVFTFADDGTYTVYGRVYDKDGGTNTYSTMVVVNNVAPTGILQLSALTVTVGQSVTAQVNTQNDPGTIDIASGLRYSFAKSISTLATNYVDASAVSSETFSYPNAGVFTLYARIFDKDNAYSEYSTSVTVLGNTSNTPPTLALSGAVDSVQNSVSIFTLVATDADAIDAVGLFHYAIQWGDGTSTNVTGGATVNVTKTYASVSADKGVFRISATVTDARGATSLPATRDQAVMGWTVSFDPLNNLRRMLTIVGSQSDDSIKVKDNNKNDDSFRVKVNNREEEVQVRGFPTANVERILIFGLSGSDDIDIDKDITVQTQVWGGDGDDKIAGGSGNDVLLGESGADKLTGGEGRDLLVGGVGTDNLSGDKGDDILIAGYTIHDNSRAALDLIMAEWTREDSDATYERRRKNLMGTAHSTFNARRNENTFLRFGSSGTGTGLIDTVFDDDAEDVLRGDQGTDWYLLELNGPVPQQDKLKDLENGEWADDI